jgi:drug/metabolite transporter (DMT)-like permease
MQASPSTPGRFSSGRVAGTLMVGGAASAWDTWGLFFRSAEAFGPIRPAVEAFLVFLASLIVLVPLALRRRSRQARPLRAWGGVLFIGCGDAANALLFFWAMQKTTLAVAVLSPATPSGHTAETAGQHDPDR